ncbi:MAG TPA: M35 family metallo-endopeptidase, partial [Blastocatellia bacterium]|nr:M35 family metallo-endopeptidase [Blastocatellia bacterium]
MKRKGKTMNGESSHRQLIITVVIVGTLLSATFGSGYARVQGEEATRSNTAEPAGNTMDLAAGMPAAASAVEYPADFPATPFPELKGCSDGQEEYLRLAWRRAHYFTWRAYKLLDHIMSQPTEAQRVALWNRDYINAKSSSVPSPRRWFGPFNQKRASRARGAIEKALKRFEMEGKWVEGIKTLRCGQPIAPKQDEHTDVCPGDNPGGDGPPGGYHSPIGTIVTCPPFWDRANDPSVDKDDRLDDSARSLVHETFHWLSVDSRYVTDLHLGKKYYGHDRARDLAENKPDEAIYNNDNYAWFAYFVGRYEPTFIAVYGPDEGSGTGGMFVDLTWEDLNSWRNKLSDKQYLSNVETYIKNGERRFTAVWRVGKGAGAMWASEWPEFEKKWKELKKTQDLIDIEVYPAGDKLMFLGVYRAKQTDSGDGGLFIDQSWDSLINKWNDFSPVAWLADVETYVKDGQRKFAAVWRPGPGNADLFWTKDGNAFKQKVKD